MTRISLSVSIGALHIMNVSEEGIVEILAKIMDELLLELQV